MPCGAPLSCVARAQILARSPPREIITSLPAPNPTPRPRIRRQYTYVRHNNNIKPISFLFRFLYSRVQYIYGPPKSINTRHFGLRFFRNSYEPRLFVITISLYTRIVYTGTVLIELIPQ